MPMQSRRSDPKHQNVRRKSLRGHDYQAVVAQRNIHRYFSLPEKIMHRFGFI